MNEWLPDQDDDYELPDRIRQIVRGLTTPELELALKQLPLTLVQMTRDDPELAPVATGELEALVHEELMRRRSHGC